MTIRISDVDEDGVGSLDLRCDPFTVVGWDISPAKVREVSRLRALADGTFDDTQYTGARAVTATIRLREQYCGENGQYTMQDLFDMLAPFTQPRRRYDWTWVLPGSRGSARRRLFVRGEGYPIAIESSKHPTVVCSWVAPDGEITSADGGPEGDGTFCQSITPSQDTEDGRTYDLTFDRVYPPSAGIGARIIHVGGNERTHWRATIYAESGNPMLVVNGTPILFTENGGLALTPGTWVTIDTRERTIYLNDDPLQSRYNRTNYFDWQWSDLMLKPGENLVRYTAETIGPNTSALFCWREVWAG